MVALWLPSTFNAYYAEVLYHLQANISESNYDIVYCQSKFGAKEQASKLASLSWPVDAILAVDNYYLLEEVAKVPELADRPVVSMGGYQADADSVGADLEAGAELAVRHLLDLGRRRIAFIYPSDTVDERDARYSAYHRLLKEAGMRPEVIPVGTVGRADMLTRIRQHIEQHGAPDAIFANNDEIAACVLRGLYESGVRVPQDCAVVGFDGTEGSAFTVPSLTTVKLPIEEMCRIGWRLVLERIDNPDRPIHRELLAPTLIVRESTAG